jgi:hypothetical protein
MSDEICVKCGSKWVVNKKYCLCDNCNYHRLHGITRKEAQIRKKKVKKVKVYQFNKKPIKSTPKTAKKRKETLNKDREFYFYQFSTKPHECEECRLNGINTPLPDEFEDENGRINFIAQYSHILGKGANPKYRHNKLNCNRLCLQHHNDWEFGDREKMKIYESNQLIINKIRDDR